MVVIADLLGLRRRPLPLRLLAKEQSRNRAALAAMLREIAAPLPVR